MAYGVDGSRFGRTSAPSKTIHRAAGQDDMTAASTARARRFSAEVAGVPDSGPRAAARTWRSPPTSNRRSPRSSRATSSTSARSARSPRSPTLSGAAVGTDEDRVDRRDGRGRLGDPHRYPRPRSDAHPAAPERGRERGVDLRQDALCLGRPAHASTAPTSARAGVFEPATWTRRSRRSRQQATRRSGSAPSPATSPGSRNVRAEDLLTRSASPISIAGGRIEARPRYGRASYIFNPTIAGIEQADAILIIGSNPRREAAVLNARIRKRWRRASSRSALIGERVDLTYPVHSSAPGPETLGEIAAGEGDFAKLRKARAAAGHRRRGRACPARRRVVVALAARVAAELGAVKVAGTASRVLHTAASRVGGLDLGFVPARRPDAPVIADGRGDRRALPARRRRDRHRPRRLLVYYRHPWRRGAHRADVILPGAAYTEKSGIYVNTEGRVQMAARAAFRPATPAKTGRSCARSPIC